MSRRIEPRLGKSIIYFPQHRGIPLDDPAGNISISFPAVVLNQYPAIFVSIGLGPIDGVVVSSVNDGHRCPFFFDGGYAGRNCAERNIDAGTEPQQLRYTRHGPAVIPVGRRVEFKGDILQSCRRRQQGILLVYPVGIAFTKHAVCCP